MRLGFMGLDRFKGSKFHFTVGTGDEISLLHDPGTLITVGYHTIEG